jgi:DNA-binding LacI/PurR family transcriptional regulator
MRAYLEELQAAGLTISSYNLPDWEETNAGFQECLTALFRVTPPTALMVDEAPFLVAALQFMARARIRVPEDVSLVSFDDDVAFAGCDPPIACMKWDVQPLIRRVLRWASLLSQSTVDTKQTFVRVTFDPGGTIGRSPG